MVHYGAFISIHGAFHPARSRTERLYRNKGVTGRDPCGYPPRECGWFKSYICMDTFWNSFTGH